MAERPGTDRNVLCHRRAGLLSALKKESERRTPLRQGVSPWDEPCQSPAARFCERCGAWFCEGHFGDPDWHPGAEEKPQ